MTVKLVPGVLLPFLAVRRAWASLLGAVVVVGSLLLLPLLIGGVDLWSHQAAWVDAVVVERFATDVNAARQRTDFTLGGQVGRSLGSPAAETTEKQLRELGAEPQVLTLNPAPLVEEEDEGDLDALEIEED